MRNARYKTIPRTNRKVPYGIARQRELIELVERRFAQAELIKNAVRRARTEHDSAKDEREQAEQTAPTEMTEPAAAEENASALADAPADAPSASAVPADALADTPADAPSNEPTASAVPADTLADAPSDEPTAAGEPLRAVTLLWHGEAETIAHPEVWLTIFDDVSEAGDAITRELVRRRFCDEPYWKTCDALYISHSAYYHNVREILHYALACAVSYGILDPRPKHPAERAS